MDQQLLDAINMAKESKEEGFQTIYQETFRYVYFRASSLVKEDDVWELVQEVYISAYKSIHTLENDEFLYAWLGGITYNLGMKLHRKNKRNPILLSEEHEEYFEQIQTEDRSIQPELSIDDKETSSILRDLISDLPELQKSALIAYYYDNMSVGEIAERFECSPGTIKSRLNYARKYLKNAITEKEKREGIRLSSISIPGIIYAIKLLQDSTEVSYTVAGEIYKAVAASFSLPGTAAAVASDAVMKSVVKTIIGNLVEKTVLIKMAIISSVVIVGSATVITVNTLNNHQEKQSVIAEITEQPSNVKSEDSVLPKQSKQPQISLRPSKTTLPEKSPAIVVTEQEQKLLNSMIEAVADYFVINNYNQGQALSDEEKMGLAYKLLSNLCFDMGNPYGFAYEENMEFPEVDFEGPVFMASVYVITEEDMELFLKTILGEGISQHGNYDGFVHRTGIYYLHNRSGGVGVGDYRKDNLLANSSFVDKRLFFVDDVIVDDVYRQIGTRQMEFVDENSYKLTHSPEYLQYIGYADSYSNVIHISQYDTSYKVVEKTKFGRFQLVSYSAQQCTDEETLMQLFIKGLPYFTGDGSDGKNEYISSEYMYCDGKANGIYMIFIIDHYATRNVVRAYQYDEDVQGLKDQFFQESILDLGTDVYQYNSSFIMESVSKDGENSNTLCIQYEKSGTMWPPNYLYYSANGLYYDYESDNEFDNDCTKMEYEKKYKKVTDMKSQSQHLKWIQVIPESR